MHFPFWTPLNVPLYCYCKPFVSLSDELCSRSAASFHICFLYTLFSCFEEPSVRAALSGCTSRETFSSLSPRNISTRNVRNIISHPNSFRSEFSSFSFRFPHSHLARSTKYITLLDIVTLLIFWWYYSYRRLQPKLEIVLCGYGKNSAWQNRAKSR